MREDQVAQVALGWAIREMRARRGVSQEELGLRTGVHRNYVGAVERAEVNPTVRTVERITAGLGISVQDLFALRDARFDDARRAIDGGRARRGAP